MPNPYGDDMTPGQWAIYVGLAVLSVAVTVVALAWIAKAQALDAWLGGRVARW